jgi:bla regulator protein BlaR1
MVNRPRSLAILFCVGLATPAFAQPPETFEVASINLGDPLQSGTSYRTEPGGSLKVEGATLKSLILFAYDLREFQLQGATGWMTADRYTILAKGEMPGGPQTYQQMNDAQRKAAAALIRKRLQALLAERFQLATHRETKDLPLYAVVVAKDGVKMQPNTSPDGSPQSMTTGRGIFKAERASPDQIAQALAGLTRRPVQDHTGLQGFYNLKMEWTPEAAAAAPGSDERPVETSGPSLFTALQEQLGLKLESRKGPIEILIIDRAERPSAN